MIVTSGENDNYGFFKDGRGTIARYRFLCVICLLSGLFAVTGGLVLWWHYRGVTWIYSPWWCVALFTGMLPQTLVISTETIFFYCFVLCFFGPAYEMIVPWRGLNL